MISVLHLWLPILVSAVGVFVASSLVHMVFKWHNSDYRKLPNEDAVAAALRAGSPPPGQYVLPYCTDMKQMQSPEFQQKYKDGPVGYVLLRAAGVPNMGKLLGQWFLLTLLVSVIAACVAASMMGAGAVGCTSFHAPALVAFAAYGCGSISDGIWKGHPWRAVAKDLLDALIYALVTGAIFALLWPG